MELYLKNKVVSLGGSSYVEDEQGVQKYQIKGKVFSFTDKKFVYDMQGNLLYIVRNKFWHLFTKKAFIYTADKEKYCLVKEKFVGRTVLVTDCPDEIVLESTGIFQPVIITKNGNKIGSYQRQLASATDLVRDSFKIEVDDEKEADFLVALVIAIDNIRDANRRDND